MKLSLPAITCPGPATIVLIIASIIIDFFVGFSVSSYYDETNTLERLHGARSEERETWQKLLLDVNLAQYDSKSGFFKLRTVAEIQAEVGPSPAEMANQIFDEISLIPQSPEIPQIPRHPKNKH